MDFAREILNQSLQEELWPLLEMHKEEIAHYEDILLDPDWGVYFNIENSGQLRVFTIRDGEILKGYGIFFVRSNPHYKSSLQAVQDVLFLYPELRGRMVGQRFIKWCDEQLQGEGVQVVMHHVKEKHNFGPMLVRMGYELVDLIYVKRLD